MIHLFQWHGLQHQQAVQGVSLAKNPVDLSQQLNQRHIILVSSRKLGKCRKLTLAETLLLFEQLCPLLRSGIPLLESMRMIAHNETSTRLNGILKNLLKEISAGRKLSEAIEYYLPAQEGSIAKILALGEHNGCLMDMMAKLLLQKNREQQVKKRLLQAMVYPAFLGVVSLGVMLLLSIWIVPEFQRTYARMDMDLPFYTQLTIAFSRLLIEHGVLVLGFFVGSIVLLKFLLSVSTTLQRLLAHFQLLCPVVGKLYKAYYLRHFSSNLGISYQAGMPIGESLAWISKTSPQHIYREALKCLQAQVSRGMSLKKALQKTSFFPPRVVQFVEVGERSGTLEQTLHSIERYYDEQLDSALTRLLTLFEPTLIVLIALGIGWIVVTMYLPVFNLGYAF